MDKYTKNLIAEYVTKHHIPPDKDNNPVPLGVLYHIDQLIQSDPDYLKAYYKQTPKSQRPFQADDMENIDLLNLSYPDKVALLLSILQNTSQKVDKIISPQIWLDILHKSIETYIGITSSASFRENQKTPFWSERQAECHGHLLLNIFPNIYSKTIKELSPPHDYSLNHIFLYQSTFGNTGRHHNNIGIIPHHIRETTSFLYDDETRMIVMPHTPKSSFFWGSEYWCVSYEDIGKNRKNFKQYNESSPLLFYILKNKKSSENPTRAIHGPYYFDQYDNIDQTEKTKDFFQWILDSNDSKSIKSQYLTKLIKSSERPKNYIETLKNNLKEKIDPNQDINEINATSLNHWKYYSFRDTREGKLHADLFNNVDYLIFCKEHISDICRSLKEDIFGYYYNPEFILKYAEKDPRAFMLASDNLFYDPAFSSAALGYLIDRYDGDEAAQRKYNVAANSIYHRVPHFFGQIEKSMDIEFVKSVRDALSHMAPKDPLPSTSYFAP